MERTVEENAEAKFGIELLRFVNEEDKRLRERLDYDDIEKRILVRTIKISEEVGELSDEVQNFLGFQREDKRKYNKEKLEGEFADVIFTTLLLAKSMNVDIVEALKKKSRIVDDWYKEHEQPK